MRRIISILLVCIILSSCNLPSRRSATPTVDTISTSVASTLEVLKSPTSNAQPIATVQPTLTITATLEPTQTEIVQPTATPSGDPKSWLGAPVKVDKLDNGNGFGLAGGYEDSSAKISVSNGAMQLNSFSTVGWRTWRVRPPDISNFYLEGIFRTINCSGSDSYGLVFRAPNYESGNGYYFPVTCDGRYGFSRWDASGNTTLVNLTNHPAIQIGAGQTNRLGVMAKNSKISLYINGNLIQELEDSSLSSGFFGIFIGGFSGNTILELDEIAYWNVP